MVLSSLLLELGQFVTGVVEFLAERVARVRFLGDVPLSGENFGLTARNLLASRGDFRLQVVVGPVLFIEEEAGIVDLLLQAAECHQVRVVTRLEIVVLEKFLILQVSVLGLNGVELIAQGKVVFVALLDLKDLSLKL